MNRRRHSDSFSPRTSTDQGDWEPRPSLLDRVPTNVLLVIMLIEIAYLGGLWLFGDGAGW